MSHSADATSWGRPRLFWPAHLVSRTVPVARRWPEDLCNAGVKLFRPTDFTYNVKSNDIYAGDTMLFGNLTLQAGLRYDIQKGNDTPGTGAANSVAPNLLPAITFSARLPYR